MIQIVIIQELADAEYLPERLVEADAFSKPHNSSPAAAQAKSPVLGLSFANSGDSTSWLKSTLLAMSLSSVATLCIKSIPFCLVTWRPLGSRARQTSVHAMPFSLQA